MTERKSEEEQKLLIELAQLQFEYFKNDGYSAVVDGFSAIVMTECDWSDLKETDKNDFKERAEEVLQLIKKYVED